MKYYFIILVFTLSNTLQAQEKKEMNVIAVPEATHTNSTNDQYISSDEYQRRGFSLLQQKKYPEAIVQYKLSLKDYPSNVDAHFNIIWMYIQLKDYSEALKSIDTALAAVSSPSHAFFYRTRGNVYTEMNDFQKGRMWLLKSLAMNDKDVYTVYNLGYNYYADKNFDSSIHYLKKAIEMGWAEKEKVNDTYFYIGTAFLELGHYDAAIEYLEMALFITEYHNYYFNLSNAYQSKGDLKQAKEVCRKGIQAFPNNAQLYHKLSQIHTEEGDFVNHDKALQKAYSLDQEDTDILLDMGVMYARWKEGTKAFKMYEKVINKGDKNVSQAFNNLVSLHNIMPNYNIQASLLFKKGIDQNPNNATLLYNYANMLKNQEKYAEAIKYYKQAIDINPSFHQAWNNLGVVCMAQNKLDEALSNFKKAYSLDKNDFEHNLNIAYIYTKQSKHYEEIVKHATTALANNLQNKPTTILYSLRANAYNYLNQDELALKDYQQVLKDSLDKEEQSVVWGNMGFCYMSLNNHTLAEQYFMKAWKAAATEDITIGMMLLKYKQGVEDWKKWRNEFYNLRPAAKQSKDLVGDLLAEGYFYKEDNLKILRELL